MMVADVIQSTSSSSTNQYKNGNNTLSIKNVSYTTMDGKLFVGVYINLNA